MAPLAYYTISVDKTKCNVNELIKFTFSYNPTESSSTLKSPLSGTINIYEDNVLIDSVPSTNLSSYDYTPTTSGVHTIKFEGTNYVTVDITVTGGDNGVTGGDSGVTWTIGNKEIKSLTINNKEVASIQRTSDNTILYEKPQESVPYVEFTFTGTTFQSFGSFQGTDMTIDYGDGTVETYTDNFYHTYAENGTHTIKIYGVTSLEKDCFKECTGLTSISIPSSVTSIGQHCFEGCTNLNVTFNWTSASDVLYCDQWFNNTSNITLTLKPLIEGNNVLIYAQKYYPLEYLPSTNLSIVQQNTLTPKYPTQCATRSYTSNSIYYTRIYSWMPIPYHNEQIANFYFENGTYTKTTNNQPLSQTYVNVYSSTTASQTKKGTVTVTIPPYKDTTNNVYYTGIKYKVSFTGLTTSVKYITITYLENDTYLTS